jgi:V-type H+-transporting ATPase subunit E
MGDSKVTSQLGNMVKFIEKEANEKAQEIRDKTQSEYTIEKAKIVIAQKEKITVEINRKQQQVLVDKRMYVVFSMLFLLTFQCPFT